ncbi:MAG: hypothetical protein DRP89_03410 [Candidatus Neomarinimicrobiota bacterium]|nr:MAG: hypothetical protein DRP89_03410 [Candidatus Neomarinimicrobiota bacterium]
MNEKKSGNNKSGNAQPYDNKISESCEKCSGKIIYRKSTYFGKTIYYKICSNCGWYRTLEKEDWRDKIAQAIESSGKKKDDTET